MACEAVSIFVVTRDVDQSLVLRLFSKAGYNENYRDQRYDLDPAGSLTSYVYRSQQPLNESEKALLQKIKSYTGRCKFFLPSGKLRNILAIPILTSTKSCCGIMKCENRDGIPEHERFPEGDFKFAITLASIIGMHYCHRTYDSIWTSWAKHKHKTIQGFAELLAFNVPSECASIFVKEKSGGNSVLRYKGGVGYKPEYANLVYPLGNKPQHFTAFVATNLQDPVRYTEKELVSESAAGRFPYRGTCRDNILSGSFRNLLAIPVMSNGQLTAVVKLENKLPVHQTFDEIDEAVCNDFTHRVLLDLLHFNAQNKTRPVDGVLFLMDQIGPAPPIGKVTEGEYRKVYEFHMRYPTTVTVRAAIEYLRIAKGTWYHHTNSFKHASSSGK